MEQVVIVNNNRKYDIDELNYLLSQGYRVKAVAAAAENVSTSVSVTGHCYNQKEYTVRGDVYFSYVLEK